MHHGSCLCGAVKYEIGQDLGPIGFCHCHNCRKVNGSAFLAATPIATENLRIEGAAALKEYESSPGVFRVFCGTCGSPIFSRRDATPEMVRLRVGSLDTPVTSRVESHIFVSQKAPWFEIGDDAPQYAERP